MKQYYRVSTLPIWLAALLMLLPAADNTEYQVTGTLVNTSEDPIPGHNVYLYNDKDERIASDVTDAQGRFTLTYQVEPTSADPYVGPDMPAEFKLGASYPNPFNPRTSVPFFAPENTQALIAIYNILGQEVIRAQADINAGSHEIQVNLGGMLSQGQYIMRVQGDGFSLTQSMTFLSAGIGSGNPEIRLQQGGRVSTAITSRIQQINDQMEYLLVVEETSRYHGKEIAIAAFENLDKGSIILASKQETHGTEVVEITSPTGRIWMDRNLGADRAATSSTDSQAYGDLYQWGRAADGHQIIHRFEGDGKTTSGTTETRSSTDQPGHGSFILAGDWRNPGNNNLWQGENGVNNPCPAGYRLPTDAEWDAEINSWSSKNASGALNSPLKLPMAGSRNQSDGLLYSVGSNSLYWSSTVSGSDARGLFFVSGTAYMGSYGRADGYSVRCLKDE